MICDNSTLDDATLDEALDLARETLYRFLAVGLGDPRRPEWPALFAPGGRELAADAARLLRDAYADRSIPLGFGELPVDDLVVSDRLLAATPDEWRDQYARIFGLITCRECPPYETEYHKAEETFFRSQQMADVAGFYQAFGLAPSSISRERPDHLELELEFSALLLLKRRQARAESSTDPTAAARSEIAHEARAAFFRDHLAWWAPSFSLGLRRKAANGLFADLGRLLAAFLPLERDHFQVAAPRIPLEADFVESPDECQGCLVQLETNA